MIDVLQYFEYALDSEYATVLNMLGLHKVVTKIFHDKYFDRVLNMPQVLIIPVLHRIL